MTTWRPTAPLGTLELRAKMLRAAREYFAATNTLEVETPALVQHGVSDVHLASIRAQCGSQTRFLHSSPEYAMKRLLAAGCGDIYQIGHVFRDGESGRYHNPEFTMIEWYRLGIDHHALMNDVEQLIAALLPAHRSSERGERISYRDAVQLHAGVDALDDPPPVLLEALASAGVPRPENLERDRDACLDLIVSTLVGPKLGRERLTFIHDFPASQASLARVQGRIASRFEAYLDGLELANGFHELVDVDEQRKRFHSDNTERANRSLASIDLDDRLLAALDHGLPECSGVALGFDRLVMCAIGASHIDEVLAFPFDRA